MKTAILSIAVSAAALFGCTEVMGGYTSTGGKMANAKTIKASENVITKTEKLQPFEKISSDVVSNVAVTQSTDNRSEIKITGPDNIVGLFQFEVKNGELNLSMKPGYKWKEKITMQVEIASPKITEIENDGVGNLSLEKIKSPSLSVKSDGVGEISLSNIETGDLRIASEGVGSLSASAITATNTKISNGGVGSIEISGKSVKTEIENSGVGSIEAGDFKSETVVVDNDGVGSITANATKTATYSKGGVGSVDITGTAKVTKK